MDTKVIIPSPVFGRHAQFIHDALGTFGIPVNKMPSNEDLLHELVCKNLYIPTTNIAGLEVNGNVNISGSVIFTLTLDRLSARHSTVKKIK